MSCHFHLLRRRRAAEAAQRANVAETKTDTDPKPKAAQKAAKSRKKGDAQ